MNLKITNKSTNVAFELQSDSITTTGNADIAENGKITRITADVKDNYNCIGSIYANRPEDKLIYNISNVSIADLAGISLIAETLESSILERVKAS